MRVPAMMGVGVVGIIHLRSRSPDAAQRVAVRCRAGAVTNAGAWYDPGSAEQRQEALHRVREMAYSGLICTLRNFTTPEPYCRASGPPALCLESCTSAVFWPFSTTTRCEPCAVIS